MMHGLSPRAAPPARLRFADMQPVRVGMPQLCRAGLSEHWLMKACGHRHWLALAAAHGLEAPDFRGARGETLYPAFVATDLTGHDLGGVRPHQLLRFDLELSRTGQTRFASRIVVLADGQPVATLFMETAFVHRAVPGANRSATRAIVARPCALLPPEGARATAFRADSWQQRYGFARAQRQELASCLVDPNPHEDFNGADFLYFAAFQAMLDRAEWQWLRQSSPLLTTTRRELFYLGNVELGDTVRAVLCGQRRGEQGVDLWIELRRGSDNTLIAVSFTQRALLSGEGMVKAPRSASVQLADSPVFTACDEGLS